VPEEVDAANEDNEGHVTKVDGERVDLRLRMNAWTDGQMDRKMDGQAGGSRQVLVDR